MFSLSVGLKRANKKGKVPKTPTSLNVTKVSNITTIMSTPSFCPPGNDRVIDADDFSIEKFFVNVTLVKVDNPLKEGETESSGHYHIAELMYEYDTEHGPIRAPIRIRVDDLTAEKGITRKVKNGRPKAYCIFRLLQTEPKHAKLIEIVNAMYVKTCLAIYCKKVTKVISEIGYDPETPLDVKLLNDPKKRWPSLWHPLLFDKDKTKITPKSNPAILADLLKGARKTNFLKATTACVPCRGAKCDNDNHTRCAVHFPPTQVNKIGFKGTAVFLFKDLYFGGKCNKFRVHLETFTIRVPILITTSTTETNVIRAAEKSGLVDPDAYDEKMKLMEEANGSIPDTPASATAPEKVTAKSSASSSEEEVQAKKPATVVASKGKAKTEPKGKAKAESKGKAPAPAGGIDSFDEQG